MATLQESKANITSRIWQSIAQSGVEVSSIPREQMQVLVSAVADGVLLAMDDMLTDVGLPQRAPEATAALAADRPDEGILWQGRPLLSLVENYLITTQRVRVVKGLLGKDREDTELVRIQDIDHKQTLGERVLNVGDIFIRSSDPSDPEIVLRNVTDPEKVHEIIRKAMIEARKRYRFTFQEEM
ncbi:MAG: PH domain-containing protein [Anaerolineae bacterium]